MKKIKHQLLIVILLLFCGKTFACSIVYYIDQKTGKIYFVNNEDYFYNVKPYIQIKPSSKSQLGRI